MYHKTWISSTWSFAPQRQLPCPCPHSGEEGAGRQVWGACGFFPLKHQVAAERDSSLGHTHQEGGAGSGPLLVRPGMNPCTMFQRRPGPSRWDPAGWLLGCSFILLCYTDSLLFKPRAVSCGWKEIIQFLEAPWGQEPCQFCSLYILETSLVWNIVDARSVVSWVNEWIRVVLLETSLWLVDWRSTQVRHTVAKGKKIFPIQDQA